MSRSYTNQVPVSHVSKTGPCFSTDYFESLKNELTKCLESSQELSKNRKFVRATQIRRLYYEELKQKQDRND